MHLSNRFFGAKTEDGSSSVGVASEGAFELRDREGSASDVVQIEASGLDKTSHDVHTGSREYVYQRRFFRVVVGKFDRGHQK